MGQFHDRHMSTRVEFDENGDNGLTIADVFLPTEILSEIFVRADYKTLLNCQLVCKRWHQIIQCYVWRKKAEKILNRTLPWDENMSWTVYYLICYKRPFERNLLKNHSGQDGPNVQWQVLSNGGGGWIVENPPIGVPPLPMTEPAFEGKQSCFATSFQRCTKMQTIELESEGLTPYVLDNLQPPIVVSEWYSCRWDCPAEYECSVKLLGVADRIIDEFHFHDNIDGEKRNEWYHMSHEFKNYGPGLRKIRFYHGGVDKLFWAGHYGSKMAGASIYIKLPKHQPSNNEELDVSPNVD